jgi:hypothetical protein
MPSILLPILNTGSPILPDMLYYGCRGPYIGNFSVETCFQRLPDELGLTYNPPPPVSPIAVTLVDPIYREVTASSLYIYPDRGDGGGPRRDP